jgi:hypothetical protein
MGQCSLGSPSGTVAVMLVPRPGALETAKAPPAWSMRSRRLRSPLPLVVPAGSKPAPSSHS